MHPVFFLRDALPREKEHFKAAFPDTEQKYNVEQDGQTGSA
jgi:hypothetical protein